MLGSVCGMIEKGPMAMHGIVGQGLGFPSRCGVRGCQVALLEDQRGRAHVKDSSEAYCPAMELRVFLRTCYIARPPATRAPQQDVIPTPDRFVVAAHTLLLSKQFNLLRENMPTHSASVLDARCKAGP